MVVRDCEGRKFEFEEKNVESIEPYFQRNDKKVRFLKINFCKRINGKTNINLIDYHNENLDGIVSHLLKEMNCL
jgi:hypothetical protein